MDQANISGARETGRLEASITKELGLFIQSASSTFTCGGRIPIDELANDSQSVAKNGTTPCFALRWDSPSSHGRISKLTFPINPADENQKEGIVKLIQDCQPASFGYKGTDVLDESYRKAAKMDRAAFSVDSCPYELGIVDTIAQVLLPNAGLGVGTKGVKAELYKLNVYAAPSGFFKAHVDTPRSDTQFGSLVVALPCHHEGGQLVVRHAGHSVTCDWGASASGGEAHKSIQWAAFYSDCEHEVLEVSEGYRITLTYNLYYTPGLGDLAGNSPVLDVRSLPLYKKVQQALAEPSFMQKGGLLGIYCQHAYAHTTTSGISSLPAILKGADMAVYSVFRALGLSITVRPIFDNNSLELSAAFYYELYHPGVKMDWNEEEMCEEAWALKDATADIPLTFVGSSLHEVIVTEAGGDESEDGVFEALHGKWEDVSWLTKPPEDTKEVGVAHLTYGNQAGINAIYSRAALLVAVQPATLRLARVMEPLEVVSFD